MVQSVSVTTSRLNLGDCVFHINFGYENISGIKAHMHSPLFDRAGEKRVLDGFVERV